MGIVVVWAVLAALVGVLANSRGRNGFGYFFLSLLLSPLIGLVIVLVTQDLNKLAEAAAATKAEEEKKEQLRREEHERQLESIKVLAASRSSAPEESSASVVDQLVKLGKLRDEGVLTAEEFLTQKTTILAQNSTA